MNMRRAVLFLLFALLACAVSVQATGATSQAAPAAQEHAARSRHQHDLLDKAKTLFEIQQFEEALDTLEQLIRQDPPPVLLQEAFFLQAAILRTTNQEEYAVSMLEQLLDEFPTASLANDARLLLGQLYVALDQPEQAEAILRRALDFSTDPDIRKEALNQLRQAYLAQTQYVDAIAAAMDELALHPDDEDPVLKGLVQELILQTMNEAELGDLLDRYPTAYPGDLATIRLIELHTSHGDEVLAERDIRAFLTRFPSHPYAQTAMALLQSFMNKIKVNDYVIAAFLPFSGPTKTYGIDSLNGIRLAIEDARQDLRLTSVGLVVKDTAAPRGALQYELMQTFNDFHPIAAIGPLLSREIQAVAPIADTYETPMLTPSATMLDVRRFGSYWFSTALTASVQVHQLVEFAVTKLGQTRFCVMSPQTAYGREMSRLFVEAVEYFNGEIIATETYHESETDVAEQILRLKEVDLALYGTIEEERLSKKKVREVYTPGFDAVFVPGKPVNLALISSQLAFYDINVPLLGGNSWHDPELFRWARHGITRGIFTDGIFLESPNPTVKQFIQRYRERYDRDPSLFSVQAYDATWLILSAIQDGARSGDAIRQQFLLRHDLPSLTGFASFNSTGVLNRKIYILQIQQNRFIQRN